LHWFSGTLRDFHTGLSNGFFFSVNPAMFNSQQGLRIISEIPKDRLLTETDSPFVTIKGTPIAPGATQSVCESIAEIWSCAAEEVEATMRENFARITTTPSVNRSGTN
jgi:TatD DNase family protein